MSGRGGLHQGHRVDESRSGEMRVGALDAVMVCRGDDGLADLLMGPVRMRLDTQGSHPGDMWGGHRRARHGRAIATRAHCHGCDGHAGSAHRWVRSGCSRDGARRSEVSRVTVLGIRSGIALQGDGGSVGSVQGVPVGFRTEWSTNPQEGDGDLVLLAGVRVPGDRALEGRQGVIGVDHGCSGGTSLLGMDGTGYSSTSATGAHRELVGSGCDAVGSVGLFGAAERLVLLGRGIVLEDDDVVGAGELGVIGIDGLDAVTVSGGEDRSREVLSMIDGCHRDDAVTGGGRTDQVRIVSFVAGSHHHDDAAGDGIAGSHGIGGVSRAIGASQREVGDVHLIGDRPVDGLGRHVGGTCASEDSHRVEIGMWGNTGANLELLVCRGAVVGSVVRVATGGDAEACDGACHM